MSKKTVTTATSAIYNNPSTEQIRAYLNGRHAKNIDELKNLKIHFQCSRSLQELADEFLPKSYLRAKIKEIIYKRSCNNGTSHVFSVVFENEDKGDFFHHKNDLANGLGDENGKYKVGAEHEYTLTPNPNPNFLPQVTFVRPKKLKN